VASAGRRFRIEGGQRAHAGYLHGRSARYLLIVKRNLPSLYAQLAVLPWRGVPVAYGKRERGHGRTERRTLKITAVAMGLAFPRRPGHPDHPPPQSQRQVAARDLLRGHLRRHDTS
jgi:hypothetical protein